MYETVLEIVTLGVIVGGVITCTVHRRSVTRQVDELRTEVACARIEGVLGQGPQATEKSKPALPAPARGQS
ncbi:hypothetical protein ABZ605_08250 [Streptomyces sp. NPDC012765]|uniref:hypothetical protein n=1 Tax=Streptomyces sp. NPDC012765 TaxID=3155249 RepID=UPI0033C3FEA7